MPWFDLPLEQLREYRTETEEPPELDQWWQLRLAQARAQAREPSLTRYEAGIYAPVEVYDAEFSGAGGDRIRAWYLRPVGADGRTPVVVKFIGYGGGRGLPTEHALLPALGYPVFVMDTRGQGGRWTTGDTGPENAQVMTRGIGRPEDYYYTRLFTDAAMAVEAVRELAGASRVAVSGSSQGGGLALATAALVPDQVAVCHADIPFLCDIQRGITLAPEAPYTEVPEFLAHHLELIPAALDTLRYVDCALLARRITARCLLSVGLMDTICPPSTVFAAYNEITAGKDISVHPFTGHVVPAAHVELQLRHLRDFLDEAAVRALDGRFPAGVLCWSCAIFRTKMPLGRSLVTEGNGHVIDPDGAARRALQAAVAERGPQVLSDPGIMDRIGPGPLAGLPGEAVLIGSAARADVPAMLRERIPALGNYGAIQSVAATLADAQSLELAACLWVVREFARALGLIAPGSQPVAASGPPPGGDLSGRGAGQEAGGPGGTAVPPGIPESAEPPPASTPPPGSGRPGRNALGIAAAIALVAVYLGVAAVAHLSPFPAKTATSTSSQGRSQGNAAQATPDASPDAAPDSDPSPPSAFQTLLNMIPGNVQGQDNCTNDGTKVGATAVAECARIQDLAAVTIFYYLFSSQGTLNSGFSAFLKSVDFTKGSASCTNASNEFVDFVVQCEGGFTSTSPAMAGSVAEYTNSNNDPIIVSSDNQQLVMAIMVGTNDGDLLAYWKQLQWITTSG